MNKLNEIWDELSREERQVIAYGLDTSVAYLRQLARGYYKPGKRLSRAIDQEVDKWAKVVESRRVEK